MSNVTFKLDSQAVRTEILQASFMESFIRQEAQKQAGADTHLRSFIGYDRAKTIIYPNTKEHDK